MGQSSDPDDRIHSGPHPDARAGHPGFDQDLHRFKYAMALFFGPIHGLGFSSYLRNLLLSGAAIGLSLILYVERWPFSPA